MRRSPLSLAALCLLAALSTTGCYAGMASTRTGVPGLLYAKTITPEEGTSVTSNVAGSKVGQASCQTFLGLISSGDCSVEAAAVAGKITRIHSVARKVENILGFYATITIIVTGE
jgi:uncharacterized protein (DUF697 family)